MIQTVKKDRRLVYHQHVAASGIPKRRFRKRKAKIVSQDSHLVAYQCDWCHRYHVGNIVD